MSVPLSNLLADLEREAGADTAAAFARLIVEDLADTPAGDGRVSTASTPAGLGALYEHLCATAHALHGAILTRPAFHAIHEPESNILCFRHAGDGSLPDDRLDARNLELRTACNNEGDGWITSTALGGRRVLRVTMMSPRTTSADRERVLNELESMGGRLLRAP